MKFEDYTTDNTLDYHKLAMPFGDFFFCDKFVVSEIQADVHFDWAKIKSVIQEIIKYYGVDKKLGYISNRVNSYSIDPQDWVKLETYDNMLVGSAVVYYNYTMYMNASIEKMFSKFKIQACLSLNDAIDWVLNLEELR